MSLLFVLACSGNKVTLGDSSADDTGLDDTDSGTETLDDTGGGDDTAPDTVPTAAVFVVVGPDQANAVELAWLWAGDAGFVIGDVFASAALEGGNAYIDLPEPPEDVLEEVPDIPGLYATYAFPYAFVDDDGDLTQDWDEVIEGAGRAWPLYLTGNIPAEFGAMGLVEGWNVVEPTGTELLLHDLDNIPLTVNLLVENDEVTIGGTNAVEMTTPRLVVLPGVLFTVWSDAAYSTRLYDDVLAAEWSVTASGPPDDSHVYDFSGTGLYGSLELPIAYDDLDGDGAVNGETETLYAACYDGYPVALMWVDPPTESMTALGLSYYGLAPGWYAYHSDAKGNLVFLDETEALSVSVDGTCSFE